MQLQGEPKIKIYMSGYSMTSSIICSSTDFEETHACSSFIRADLVLRCNAFSGRYVKTYFQKQEKICFRLVKIPVECQDLSSNAWTLKV